MEAATTEQDTPPIEGVSSFAKSLFLGEIHEDLVFPFPKPDEAEQEQDPRRSCASAARVGRDATTRARPRRTAGSATTTSPSSASAG